MPRTSALAFALILLGASAGESQQLVNNFPVNGLISAFQVNAGYSVSESFTLAAGATAGEVAFGAWLTPGDSVTGVSWSIGTTAYDTSIASGVAGATSSFNSSNADGYDVHTVNFALPGITLPAGTYYLTLSAAISAGANPVYWDINDAAGLDAWASSSGHVSAANTCFQVVGISGSCAPSFQILSTSASVTPSPSSVTFPNQTVNTTSTAQVVTVTNNGAGAATISGIAITGANAADFGQTNNCPSSLASGAFCTVSVTFKPQAASAFSAAVTITGSSPLSVPLSGTGTPAPPSVTLAPSPVNFPNQTVNTTSTVQNITLTNAGPGALTISSIAIGGGNPGDFAQSNNCPISPATLAANGFCTIGVTFTPQAASPFSATVTVSDNGVATPQSVNLNGTGTNLQNWPNGYAYEATFTVAAGQVPSTQNNFAALISGTFADFATTANGGKVANTCTQTAGNNATTVPCDLIFTSDAAGTMPVSWEFETYSAATGAANIWVNVPSIGNGTVLYAWYGQPSVTTLQTTPSAAWSSNVEAVYHLKENPAGAAPQMNDSTSNANHATMNGPVQASQQQPGEIDGAINFEGNTWAGLANPANFSFERTDSFSLSGWLMAPSNSGGTLISKVPAAGNSGWGLLQFAGSSKPSLAFILVSGSTQVLVETPAITTGVWHNVAVTYSGTGTAAGIKIYIDGVSQTLTTLTNNLAGSIVNAATPVISGRGGPTSMSSDILDEIRVSAKGVVLTPDSVTASYNSQSHPGTFFTAVTGLTSH